MRRFASVVLLGYCLLFAGQSRAATLEKLSIDEMAQRSTQIVRGKISGCFGATRGSVIVTRCSIQVSERWKGPAGSRVDFYVPGGTAGSRVQVFTGTPKFALNQDYVIFLWAGKSGLNQVIGLSQGVFDVRTSASTGKATELVERAASSERILDAGGQPVKDQGVEMSLSALRLRVAQALGGTTK